jgi:hypothetical protein
MGPAPQSGDVTWQVAEYWGDDQEGGKPANDDGEIEGCGPEKLQEALHRSCVRQPNGVRISCGVRRPRSRETPSYRRAPRAPTASYAG